MTNLEKMLKYFPKAEFTSDDNYETNFNGFWIEWLGDGEHFTVNRDYLDLDVGHVSDTELYHGNFDECLEYLIKENGL